LLPGFGEFARDVSQGSGDGPGVGIDWAESAGVGGSGISLVPGSAGIQQRAIEEIHRWDWQVELAQSPDKVLAESEGIVATADSVILDRCGRWFNLARYVVDEHLSGVWMVDLSI